jgi:hypothetical protein
MRYEVFTAVKIWVVVFWAITLFILVGSYQRVRGNYYPENAGNIFLLNVGHHLHYHVVT